MNTGRCKIIIGSIIVAMALASSAVHAQPSCPADGKEKGWAEKKEVKRQELYKELNVTEEQKKALEENKNKHREEMKALFTQEKEKRALISQELQKGALDMARINQINDELKKLQAQMSDQRLERILEVRRILTPDQFKKFISKIEERANRSKDKFKGK